MLPSPPPREAPIEKVHDKYSYWRSNGIQRHPRLILPDAGQDCKDDSHGYQGFRRYGANQSSMDQVLWGNQWPMLGSAISASTASPHGLVRASDLLTSSRLGDLCGGILYMIFWNAKHYLLACESRPKKSICGLHEGGTRVSTAECCSKHGDPKKDWEVQQGFGAHKQEKKRLI